MTHKEWNEKQNVAFESFFKEVPNGYSLKQFMVDMHRRRSVWQRLYKIVGEELAPGNNIFKFNNIKKVQSNGKTYLMIRVNIWGFVVIDVNDMRCIEYEEATRVIDSEIYRGKFNIRKEEIGYLYFDILSDDAIKDLVDFFVEEERIITGPKTMRYKFYKSDDVIGTVFVFLDCMDTMISVNDSVSGRINYVFLNSNLKAYSTTNPTGNKDDIISCFDGTRDAYVPFDLIDRFDEFKENTFNGGAFVNKI